MFSKHQQKADDTRMGDSVADGDPNVDSVIHTLGGCGRFQVLVVLAVFTAEFASPFSLMFMSFGGYNPGWRCLDNDSSLVLPTAATGASENLSNASPSLLPYPATAEENNKLTTMMTTSGARGGEFIDDKCPDYEACRHVEFNPESITIISEWELICDRAWIPTVILSVQMVGVMIGAYFGGWLGDKIGRQRSIFVSMALNGILNLVAGFSISWHMFIVLRFFIGATYACFSSFPFVYSSELTPDKWRSFLASLPAWNVGASVFAVTAMLTKNWRHMHFITAGITLLFVFPILWAPESLRWLTVKGKIKRAVKVATKIASINKKSAPKKETFENLAAQYQMEDGSARKYSWHDLWRKDVRLYTFIFGFIWISMAVVYYTTSFGAKNLVGNIYVNLIILFMTEIPVSVVSTLGPNLLGRKWSTFAFFLLSTVCLFSMVFIGRFAIGDGKGTAIFVLVLFARFGVNGAWFVLYTLTAEIYPTVIRGTSLGYGSCLSRIGGIVAPYLIPNDRDSNFISFLIMACLIGICCVLLLFLPETKGRSLTETWSDEVLAPSPTSSSCSSAPEEMEQLNVEKSGEKV